MTASATATAIDRAHRLMTRSDELARFSEEADRLTRPYGSPSLHAARETIVTWMTAAGMTVRYDAIGNVIGRYEAARRQGGEAARDDDHTSAVVDPSPPLPPLLIGGHIDTVRDAGKYDGTLGVLIGIACVEGLRDAEIRMPFPIEVIAFVDEDGLRFHTAYLASWAFAGTLDPALLARTDAEGISVAQAIRDFGGDPDAIGRERHDVTTYRGYVEAHIEQGPALEAANLPVGVVSAIAGQTRFAITLTGEAGHAGTVPMQLRRDALGAAAEVVLLLEAIGRATDGLVATVGQLSVEPGASNVVPGYARLTVDLRHADDAVRLTAITTLLQRLQEIADRRNVGVTLSNRNDAPAVIADPQFTADLVAAVSATGCAVHQMVSGAGHDAVALSAQMPVGMLFVRCGGGISHNPAESVSLDDVAVAIDVIDVFVRGLDVE